MTDAVAASSPGPEQARSIARRARVLAAALRLLLSGGSAAVTHRRVAEDSDSSPGVVRYYFHTREDLLAACLEQLHIDRRESVEEVLRTVAPDAPAADVARAALEIYFGENLDDATVTGTVWSVMDCARESTRLGAMLREHRLSAEEQLQQLLTSCGYPDVSPTLVAAILDGSTLSSTLERTAGAAEVAIAELTPVLLGSRRD